MKTISRIFAYGLIGTSILSLILAIFSIVSIWRVNEPLTQALVRLADAAERSLKVANEGLEKVDGLLTLLSQSMVEVQDNADQLKADMQTGDPILLKLSDLVGLDIGPKIEQAVATLQSVNNAIQSLNATVQTFNAMPFIQLDGITEGVQKLADLTAQIEQEITGFKQQVGNLKQGVTTTVIQPIQDQAVKLENDLANAQQQVQELQPKVQTGYQAVLVVGPQIPSIIDLLSTFITIQLVWSMFTQAALIYLAWMYLKFGRFDLHNLIASESAKA